MKIILVIIIAFALLSTCRSCWQPKTEFINNQDIVRLCQKENCELQKVLCDKFCECVNLEPQLLVAAEIDTNNGYDNELGVIENSEEPQNDAFVKDESQVPSGVTIIPEPPVPTTIKETNLFDPVRTNQLYEQQDKIVATPTETAQLIVGELNTIELGELDPLSGVQEPLPQARIQKPVSYTCLKWSDWLDRDDPTATGDWETKADLIKQGLLKSDCLEGTLIEGRVKGSNIPALAAGQNLFAFNPVQGLICRNQDQKIDPLTGRQIQCFDYEVRFCCDTVQCKNWSSWLDRDDPTATGDYETLSDLLLERKLDRTCNNPTAIQAREKTTTGTGLNALQLGQVLQAFSPSQGLICVNSQQATGTICKDYEVRFCCDRPCDNWSPWVDRDDPSATGDWEDLNTILSENRIPQNCYAPTQFEARVVSTKQDFRQTGQTFLFNNPGMGIVCKNSATQKCLDYEVRFCCDVPCNNWSNWLDRDDPTGYGDFETVTNLVSEQKLPATCRKPTQIQARVKRTLQPASTTGQIFSQYNAAQGLICLQNQNNYNCHDYEVRFCCDPACNKYSNWIDRDNPSGVGDFETVSNMLTEQLLPQTCKTPSQIQGRTKTSHVLAQLTGEYLNTFNPTVGLACINSQQPDKSCLDYEVRFCCDQPCLSWSNWVDRDNPSGYGDFETLSNLINEKLVPETCRNASQIEGRVKGTLTPAQSSGQTLNTFNPLQGLICLNAQNPNQCLDYEVRFCCAPQPTCNNWSPWIDRDNPSGYGDFETISDMISGGLLSPGCRTPTQIQGRLVANPAVSALSSGVALNAFDTTTGLVCLNSQNTAVGGCKDFEVRFCCDTCLKWSNWLSRDLPSGDGDWESIPEILPLLPSTCQKPSQIEARVVGTTTPVFTPATPASVIGQTLTSFNAQKGLVCLNSLNNNACKNYEVRFCCA